jgi:hypothetical protein
MWLPFSYSYSTYLGLSPGRSLFALVAGALTRQTLGNSTRASLRMQSVHESRKLPSSPEKDWVDQRGRTKVGILGEPRLGVILANAQMRP